MATILDLTAQIVSAHASSNQMTSEELLQELQKVYTSLQALEGGNAPLAEQAKPTLTAKQAFKKDEVICLVCGKGGMKTLTRHIKQAHDLKPGQYRKQFGIPRKQPLTAKSYSETRKKMAEERGLGNVLAKARKVRAAKLKGKKIDPSPKATPAKMIKPMSEKTTKPKSARKIV